MQTSRQPSSGIAAIIFDYGNVIDRFDHNVFLKKLTAHTGKPLDELNELTYDSGLNMRYETGQISSECFFKEATEKCGLSITEEEFRSAFVGIWTPIHETYALIRKLKQNGYKLGLLSNTSPWYFEDAIQKLDVFTLFDAVTTSFQTGLMKPDRRMYEDIMTKLGARPEQCTFIDDIEEYAEAANRLGLRGIHYESPEQLITVLQRIGVRV